MSDTPEAHTGPQPGTHPGIEQLRLALREVEKRDVDPLTAPWTEIEPGIAKLLGGPFSPDQPEHTPVAFLLAAAFGERVCRDLGGFWFPNRSTPDGAAIGFPEVMLMFSPLDVVLQALSRARLTLLDDVAKDLAGTLSRARAEAAAGGGAPPRIGPDDYRRLFDPGFVQLVCIDRAKVRSALGRTPAEAAREVEDALSRVPASVPANVRSSMRDQIAGALRQLPGDGPVASRAGAALPLVELLGLLEGAVETTRFAPAELWQHVLIPLLHIGAAETFPPLDADEREALREGTDPLVMYVDTVPFSTPAEDEDGLLGVFPPDSLGVMDPCFERLPTVRTLTVPVAPLAPLAAKFDRNAVRASVERFTRHAVGEAQGAGEAAPNVESQLLPIALELLGELARVVGAVGEGEDRALCLRRAPEAEAASDAALKELRRAMQGSRIILI
ncbi:MAG TPA: hypothetical protein VHK47_09550 [Polyangia bacterium]|jgi:hypothetical protein|nr:hypothetical protein [Polyangia bacterium]